jgi:chemotaxis protein methyltransferase CheR
MSVELAAGDLSPAEFKRISELAYQVCRIKLPHGKEELVKGRLSRRLRALGLATFSEYITQVENDESGEELTMMIDALTTNKTSFFREPDHFQYLGYQVIPALKQESRRVRIWSAGCSSGEEAYTIAIVLREQLPDIDQWDARILATDISTRMLSKARQGVYDRDALGELPSMLLSKYFTCLGAGSTRTYRVQESLRSLVRLARLNLMERWPMKGPFDAIFCRNVMIYFDQQTQEKLIERFWDLLPAGGHLFIGHAENLRAASSDFHYVQPAVYIKPT